MSFDKIIGQEKVKRKLSFYLDGQHKTLLSPHLLFVAPRGSGKTLLAQTYASQLLNSEGKKRKLITINCSTLTSLKAFINDVCIPYVSGKEVTILFDEASEIPSNIRMAMLTILNPNKENRNEFTYDDVTIEFDYKKVTFLFATTEAHKIFHALIDRLERIDLEEYSNEDLGMIVQKNINSLISSEAMKEVKQVLRGNARKATQMANHISLYLGSYDKKSFDIKDWHDFQSKLGINPLGLNPMEIKILKVLRERPLTTLTNLSAKTQMSRQSLQRDAESYLQKLNLMEILATGRKITPHGRQYLESLK
jgi:Holliday junction resolvasome RuvABC ATP-dependent DNA helicase subunit